MTEDQKTIVRDSVRELITKLGFECEIEIISALDEESEDLICNIRITNDSHILIGQYGVNLQALQHIARLIVRKKTADKTNFTLDVNSYRQEKNQTIIELARTAAAQAIEEKRVIILKPMSAYDRRLVHMELSKNKDILTESIGEGEGRKIVVKPSGTL